MPCGYPGHHPRSHRRARDVGEPRYLCVDTGGLGDTTERLAALVRDQALRAAVLQAIAARRGIPLTALAYIGDDVNDLEAMALAGLSACPGDAFVDVREQAHIVCTAHGGHGAFREFAEILLAAGTPQPG